MIYKWRSGYGAQADAQRVGEQLEALRIENDGRLDPRDIVVEARQDKSPLHKYFEWRDGVAATKYREEQARTLIRHIVVIYDEQPDKWVPAFVCVEKGAESPYQATRVALQDSDSREYVLNAALRELKAWRARYAHLQEFGEVLRAIDGVLAVEHHEAAA